MHNTAESSVMLSLETAAMQFHRAVYFSALLYFTFIFVALQACAGEVCSVQRERYIPHPAPGVAPDVAVAYVGSGLRRREVHSTQSRSDIADKRQVRTSDDNGRTWSAFEPLNASEDLKQNGVSFEQYPYVIHHDPASGRTVEMWYQRIYLGDIEQALNGGFKGLKKYYDHCLYRHSSDDGRTWTELRPLVYEQGAPFNPANWADAKYLKTNEVSVAYTIVSLADGRIALPVTIPVRYEEDEEDKKVCARVPWIDAEKGFVPGTMVFFGTWNAQKNDFDWTHSAPLAVRRYVSTRGLEEPALAQFKDGTLLLDMRGSNARLNPEKYPGRRWISLSKDGGNTWSAVTDLRFDTGEQFFSPATFSRLMRSSKTGKLYWVGNISKTPPKGNGPRYPLYIAEVDESKAALKKSTLTLIDDRGPTDTAELQLSNFSLLENRETKDLEIFLTRLGERADSVYSGDVYKYTLKLFDTK